MPKVTIKGSWHKDSLWRDLSIVPTQLEGDSIFRIIMPWVEEQEAELKSKEDKKDQKSQKKSDKGQTKLNFGSKPKTDEKTSIKQTIETKAAKEESKTVTKPDDISPELKLKLLSKVMKMADIEKFEWRYKPNILT